jgi:hypothetical protein
MSGDSPSPLQSIGQPYKADKLNSPEADHPGPETVPAPPPPRRGPGHRGVDMRDTVAEMAEKAQLISQEAGSKVGAAMKDVISAAAGIAGFAIESARDLVQYMVRRGQMTQDEADKLIREAEAAHDRRPTTERGRPTATKVAAERAAQAKADAAARAGAALAAMQTAPHRVVSPSVQTQPTVKTAPATAVATRPVSAALPPAAAAAGATHARPSGVPTVPSKKATPPAAKAGARKEQTARSEMHAAKKGRAVKAARPGAAGSKSAKKSAAKKKH